jgi:hypothetical protein
MAAMLPSTYAHLVQFKEGEIVSLTIEQIQKDLSMFGIHIHFSGDVSSAYNEVHTQLTAAISQLLKTSHSKLYSVFYRIDLSENDIRKGLPTLPAYNEAEGLAHLIIVRELKKVITRKYYS